MERRTTRHVRVGDVTLGGTNKVAIQTMWASPMPASDDERALESLFERLRSFKTMGCDIVRFSYPNMQDHAVFTRICQESPMPVVADIHFDWRLAMDAFACGAHKIRINPGNIGSRWKVEEVIRSAKDHDGAIRIGLNGGSLPVKLRSSDHAEAMVETALTYLEWFEKQAFDRIVVSLKDSDPETTYRANCDLASRMAYPLHLGVTEAGGVVSSVTRSTWVLGRLLSQGIGDTLRISITDDRMYEIQAARELLRTIGLESAGIRVVSCPRCGRSTFDSQGFLKRVQSRLLSIDRDLTVAIMGCQVNGPGEAAHADVAITGIGTKVFLYRKGRLVREVGLDEAEEALYTCLEAVIDAQ